MEYSDYLFVTREQAIGLKNLGFNEPCVSVFRNHSPYYDKMISGYESDLKENKEFSKNSDLTNFTINQSDPHYWLARPLVTQTNEWLKNKFGLWISVMPELNQKRISDWGYLRYDLWNNKRGSEFTPGENSPGAAMNLGVNYTITILEDVFSNLKNAIGLEFDVCYEVYVTCKGNFTETVAQLNKHKENIDL